MTRKDFILVAEAMARIMPETAGDRRIQWDQDVLSLAYSFKQRFPNFDEKQFIDACYEREK